MATPADDRQIAKQRFDSLGSSVGDSRNMGFDVRHSHESGYVAVAVLMMVFVCLIVPLMAMLYFDTLTLQKKTAHTEARIEKLLKNLEEKDKK